MTLAEHLIKSVSTVHQEDEIADAARLMKRDGVGCVVVVNDEGQSTGMVTDRDLALRGVGKGLGRDTAVAELMSAPLVSANPDASMEEIVELMREGGVRRVPVLEGGRPIGLVALDDLVHSLSAALSSLSRTVEAEVSAARRRGHREAARANVEDGLERLGKQLRQANWYAQGTILGEFDALRDRIARALGSD